MTFATPLLAGLAAAVAIPTLLILYFLKLKRRDLEVSTTLLWKKSIEDLQANAPFQRLRNNILLILQMLALLAALLALAQPEIRQSSVQGERHVILIDRSASMNSVDGDEKKPGEVTRLAKAKELALEVVSGLREPGLFSGDGDGDEAMVVAFDVTADRVLSYSKNKTELRRAIESIAPSDAETSFAAGYQTARAFATRVAMEDKGMVTTGGGATIHLLSDGRMPDLLTTDTTADDRFVYYPIGSETSSNMAITALRSQRAFEDPTKLEIFVGVQSTAMKPVTLGVNVSVNGRTQGIPTLTLPAARRLETTTGEGGAGAAAGSDGVRLDQSIIPASGGVVFPIDLPGGAIVTARLNVPDSGDGMMLDVLEKDNVGAIVVPPAKRLSVLLVTSGNLFLKRLMESLPLAKLEVLTPEEAAGRFTATAAPSGFDVMVLDAWLPGTAPEKVEAGQPSGPKLPPGNYMIFGAIPGGNLGVLDEGLGEATVVISHEKGHPAFRNVVLDPLTVNPARKIKLPERSGVKVLAEGLSGPLVYEATDLNTRALVATFNLLESTWPIDVSFVLYVAQGMQHVASGASGGLQSLRPGQTIEQSLPLDAADARVTLPDGTRQSLLVSPEGRVVFGPVMQSGLYTISWTGSAGPTDSEREGRWQRVLAVNMLSPGESDVATASSKLVESKLANATSAAASQGTLRLWPYALVLMLVILLVEWFVYNKKVTV
jgi:hypothetical protein